MSAQDELGAEESDKDKGPATPRDNTPSGNVTNPMHQAADESSTDTTGTGTDTADATDTERKSWWGRPSQAGSSRQSVMPSIFRSSTADRKTVITTDEQKGLIKELRGAVRTAAFSRTTHPPTHALVQFCEDGLLAD